MIAADRKEWSDALAYLKRSLAGSAPSDSITRKLYALIARVHETLGDPGAALQTCANGLAIDPEDAELWFRKGIVHRRCHQPEEAERAWRRILSLRRPEKFASLDQGIFGHVTRRNLAALAHERGDLAEAERLWRAVLAECPGDQDAMKHLA
jgi:tetratricopeptide (TPR) repeat protein